ncbi:PTS sugar transporter subunit IIC [Anaerosacchariphilus polymeriproducens]|uniref:Permease IIC component n=1 Tax=Anaerosacchariphilus polymeriproducens TaxID=1812858 RepID=A0A371AYQ5_9FIRM|nr:PTS transporter subunit EIIC [Anaerosacchariphilus polymeriproducens]RDU24691.1 PTS sugar transporter subunit IIC [Anaerosacchariphilus polymeriproducens]
MKKFMDWLKDSFAPTMNKVVENSWVSAVSQAMMRVLPFILVGSLVFFYNVFVSYVPSLPNLNSIQVYSFSFIGIFIAFLIPYNLMELKKRNKFQIPAGLLGFSSFIMCLNPKFDENNFISFSFGEFGPSGIMVAIVVGLIVAFIFNLWTRFGFLEDSATIPGFLANWINSIVPIFVTLLIIMLAVTNGGFNLVNAVNTVFKPVAAFGQSYPGMIFMCLTPAILYSCGISSWAFGAISTPVFMAGINANIAAIAAGGTATNIVTSETVFTAALITMGGMGATLPLVVQMLFSKSKKLKTLGRVCVAPSIFNINEPVIYGTPIAFNPMLMLPLWINSITGPTIVYFAMKTGLLNIPGKMIQVGQVPAPISSVMITEDLRAIIFYVILFAVYFVTWLPFYKVYESQCVKEEMEQAEA